MTDHERMTSDEVEQINRMLDENLASIRRLNDDLRQHRRGGTIVITSGIAGLGPSQFNQIVDAVARFESFNPDNDPYGEHDCAVMTVGGIRIIWKIDYYDKSRQFLSPDAADPDVTARVMTIMRADEY